MLFSATILRSVTSSIAWSASVSVDGEPGLRGHENPPALPCRSGYPAYRNA
jgi:hypothetical protein